MLNIIILSLLSFSAQAKLTAQIDRTQISENDSLNYSLTLDETSLGSEPDFSALNKDFSILSKSQSSSLKIINGHSSAYTSWRLTLSPLRLGTITIPAIAFQGQMSKPLSLQVSSSNQTTNHNNNDPVYLTLSAGKINAYVGEQIILTVRIYHQVDILDGNLSDITANNATIQPLDRKKIYTTKVNGETYEVIEQKYAFFAQQSGIQTIAPLQLDAIISQPNNSPSDFFSPLNANNQKQTRIRSNKLTLSIKPKPANYPANAPWLPTSDLSITTRWNPNIAQLKIGDPITQITSINAKGIQGNSLPEIKTTTPTGVKNYPDQSQIKDTTTDDGITGNKTQSIAWVATSSGTIKIPEQMIYWWNTQKNQLESTVIPGRTLQVIAASGINPIATLPTNQLTEPKINTLEKNKSAVKSNAQIKKTLTANSINQSVDVWKILSLVFGAIILLLLIALYYFIRQLDQQKISTDSQKSEEKSEKSLKECTTALLRACNDNDAQATKQAINTWIEAYAERNSISTETAHEQLEPTEFYFRLNELNDSLYGKSQGEEKNSWSGKLLKHAFLLLSKELNKKSLNKKPNQPVKSTHLAELYPK